MWPDSTNSRKRSLGGPPGLLVEQRNGDGPNEKYTDAVDDGKVVIAGVAYDVAPTLLAAMRAWPAHYNAGLVGPDGFPDLVMGQSIIHPSETGQWLRYLLQQAWAAQDNPAYSAAEQGQILAFTYGYMTHAAGDTFAHTLVNEFAGETFPEVGDILTNVDEAEFAIRHLLIEGYIGDATPGVDGNPDRTGVPSSPYPDVSDDSTPRVAFDSPNRWIYNTLVNRSATGAPTTDRGKLINFFYDLRDDLQSSVDSTPMPLQDALDAYNDTSELIDSIFDTADCRPEDAQVDNDGDGAADDGCGDSGDPDRVGRGEDESGACSFGIGNTGFDIALDIAVDLVACPIALTVLGITATVDSFEAAFALAKGALALAGDARLDAYFSAWIDDIDEGLAAWGELGLATTRGLFDPQTRRNGQNEDCSTLGPESEPVRITCENKFGPIDAVVYSSDDFINNHLIPMLGFPDFIGGLREALGDLSAELDALIGQSLNPSVG